MSLPHLSSPANSNQSLLSLSIAAAHAAPLTALSEATAAAATALDVVSPVKLSPSLQGVSGAVSGFVNAGSAKHCRVSSVGRSRRRLSDIHDAVTRPFPTALHSTSTSLAALSLSSPTLANVSPILPTAQGERQSLPILTVTQMPLDDTHRMVNDSSLLTSLSAGQGISHGGVSNTRVGRRRGSVFTCESCSKVYRHPSCLIKHRWEHTPQWREASKFVLSKHQQVQLLEAAAILSHLSPSCASLPEDRSLWPSFLSGGLVPPPASGNYTHSSGYTTLTDGNSRPTNISTLHPISSSVPTTSLSPRHPVSTGPRLHDYAIPHSAPGAGGGGVTQVRPGVLGVPTISCISDAPNLNSSQQSSLPTPPSTTGIQRVSPAASDPMPVPVSTATSTTTTHDDALNLLALRTASVRSTTSVWSWGDSSRSYDVSSMSLGSPISGGSASSRYKHMRTRSHTSVYTYQEYGHGHGYVNNGQKGPGMRGHAKSFSETSCSLPRSSVRSQSSSSHSPSLSEGKSEDEGNGEAELELADADGDEGVTGDRYGYGYGHSYECVPIEAGVRFPRWKVEEDEDELERSARVEVSGLRNAIHKVAAKPVQEMWDGMEMEMEMD